MPLTASDIYALSQNRKNEGKRRCHWCGSACTEQNLHNDEAPVPFVKNKTLAKLPSEPYCCVGCWLWRRPRITAVFLDGTFIDIQAPVNHSWWITPTEAKAVKHTDFTVLYELLLKPPKQFVLTLVNPDLLQPKTVKNWLHLAKANDVPKMEASTLLHYTINNVAFSYSPYELEEALRNGDKGKEPGVGMLIKTLGNFKLPEIPMANKVGKRIPDGGQVMKKTVLASGEMATVQS